MDGSLLESTEVIDDTTTTIEWFANGEKRRETKTVLGNDIYIEKMLTSNWSTLYDEYSTQG